MSRPASAPEPTHGVLFPQPGARGGGGVPGRTPRRGPGAGNGASGRQAPARGAVGDPDNPRWTVAHEVSDALRARYGAHLQAVGVRGTVAHGDDTDASDLEIVVVTRRPGFGPAPVTRRVNGVIVDLSVITADEYLRHARTLTTSWPLVADQYLTTKAVHDPDGWLPRLRDAHLTRLAQADGQLFASLAREAWCRATIAHGRARRTNEPYETGAAMMVLAEARLAVAVVDGLLTRTYFRHSADAVRLAGVASANVIDLGERLTTQSFELARRGRPVDGDITDLLP